MNVYIKSAIIFTEVSRSPGHSNNDNGLWTPSAGDLVLTSITDNKRLHCCLQYASEFFNLAAVKYNIVACETQAKSLA